MQDFSIFFVADAEDFVERLALGEFYNRIVELAAADEVEG